MCNDVNIKVKSTGGQEGTAGRIKEKREWGVIVSGGKGRRWLGRNGKGSSRSERGKGNQNPQSTAGIDVPSP